jgi:hypothetical protein
MEACNGWLGRATRFRHPVEPSTAYSLAVPWIAVTSEDPNNT